MVTTPPRIGLLGDIHANCEAVDLALRVFADAGIDLVVAVGDIVDGPGDVDDCSARLLEAGVLAVRGNHERWFLSGAMRDLPGATLALGAEARRFLATLPSTRRFPMPDGEILLCHGLGDDDMASVALDADSFAIQWNDPLQTLLEEDRPLWVLNGHTHRPGVWTYQNLTVINGGTFLRDQEPCFSIVDLGCREVTYFGVLDGKRIGRRMTSPLPR